ncbi:MAG: hypothetical protein JXL80_17995 [Planctomycetes bacterium]|nr:hypothetical protein [Planctomycetota bacterium]
MRPRNSEAERLEIDYLFRLNAALEGHEPASRAEIVESLREHIEEALGEGGAGTVGLAEITAVLERLGPPETVAHAEDASPQADAWSQSGSEPVEPACAAAGQDGGVHAGADALSPETIPVVAAMLEKVWWAYLVMAIGLYVPFIDLQFCDIIGLIIFIVAANKYKGPQWAKLRGAAWWSTATVVLLFLLVPAEVLNLMHPGFGLLVLPVSLAMAASQIISYWLTLETAATVMDQLPRPDLAGRIRGARIVYLVCTAGIVAVSIVVGTIVVLAVKVQNPALAMWWLGYAMLPLGWLVSWLFWLRPITLARRALLDVQPASRLTAA